MNSQQHQLLEQLAALIVPDAPEDQGTQETPRARGLRVALAAARRTAVDEHKVWGRLNGIETKLRVNGHEAPANFLRACISRLVPAPSANLSENERTIYAVMDLLMHLSDSLDADTMHAVTRAAAERMRGDPIQQQMEQYEATSRLAAELVSQLMPTPAHVARDGYASDSSSDWNSSTGGDDHNGGVDDVRQHPTAAAAEDAPSLVGGGVNAHSALAHVPSLLQLQYWRRAPGIAAPCAFDADDPHTLAIATAFHASVSNAPLPVLPAPSRLISEVDIIRESTFLLRGLPTTLYLSAPSSNSDPLNRPPTKVRESVGLTHLVGSTVTAAMLRIARIADTMMLVRAAVNAWVQAAPTLEEGGDLVRAAIGGALGARLAQWDTALDQIDMDMQGHPQWKTVHAGDRPTRKASLLSFSRSVDDPFWPVVTGMLRSLCAATQAGLAHVPGSRILDAVTDQLTASQLTPDMARWLDLFLAGMRPLGMLLDRWLAEGDPRTPSQTGFWISTTSAGVAAPSPRYQDNVWAAGFLVSPDKVPAIFADVSDEILALGKTMAMANAGPPLAGTGSRSYFGALTVLEGDGSRLSFYQNFAAHLLPLVLDTCQLSDWKRFTDPRSPPLSGIPSNAIRVARPILGVIQECIAAALKPVVEHSSRVVAHFVHSHLLTQHLQLLSAIFLMEDGDVWNGATLHLFRRLRRRQHWDSPDTMTDVLGTAVTDIVAKHSSASSAIASDMFQVVIAEGRRGLGSAFLDCRPTWPTNAIILDSHLEGYNRVFRALLHLRLARFMLEDNAHGWLRPVSRWRTSELDGILGLRFTLLHAIKAIESYWMITVLDSERTAFLATIATTRSIDALIKAHTKFIGNVLDMSLLNSGPLADAIGQLFGQCSEFAALFDHFLHSQQLQLGDTSTTIQIKPQLVAAFHQVQQRFLASRSFLLNSLEILTTKANVVYLESLMLALAPPADSLSDNGRPSFV
ncbi:Spc98 family-domain-containing protein [Blastocladiella britannica]|nr:Spc98 family-domain-containing protein [Blastocladiella britannica]